MSEWINHVKQYAKTHNMKYSEALKHPDCKKQYSEIHGGMFSICGSRTDAVRPEETLEERRRRRSIELLRDHERMMPTEDLRRRETRRRFHTFVVPQLEDPMIESHYEYEHMLEDEYNELINYLHELFLEFEESIEKKEQIATNDYARVLRERGIIDEEEEMRLINPVTHDNLLNIPEPNVSRQSSSSSIYHPDISRQSSSVNSEFINPTRERTNSSLSLNSYLNTFPVNIDSDDSDIDGRGLNKQYLYKGGIRYRAGLGKIKLERMNNYGGMFNRHRKISATQRYGTNDDSDEEQKERDREASRNEATRDLIEQPEEDRRAELREQTLKANYLNNIKRVNPLRYACILYVLKRIYNKPEISNSDMFDFLVLSPGITLGELSRTTLMNMPEVRQLVNVVLDNEERERQYQIRQKKDALDTLRMIDENTKKYEIMKQNGYLSDSSDSNKDSDRFIDSNEYNTPNSSSKYSSLDSISDFSS